MRRVAIVISTIAESHLYIEHTLLCVFKEMGKLEAVGHNPILIVAINGGEAFDQKITWDLCNRLAREHLIEIITESNPDVGKNGALNICFDHAQKEGCEIVVCLDDDIRILPGTILACVSTLESERNRFNLPVLVGAHCRARFNSGKWLERMFAIPYSGVCGDPPTVSGQCLAFHFGDCDEIPDDDRISADAYLNCHFISTLSDEDSVPDEYRPIVRAKDAVIHFRVATSLPKWFRQKVRESYSINCAESLFIDYTQLITKTFTSPFSFNPLSRSALRFTRRVSFHDRSLAYLFQFLLSMVNIRSLLFSLTNPLQFLLNMVTIRSMLSSLTSKNLNRSTVRSVK